MSKLLGFQTMVILDLYGMTFAAIGIFGVDFQVLFKPGFSYCDKSDNSGFKVCLFRSK